MAYLGRQPVLGNFVKLDAITVVNGQAAYTMQNGGVNFTDYTTVNQFLVSLNGTIQAATDSFTVSGSTITFASTLSTVDVIDFIIVFGNSLSAGTVSDSAITTAKLADDAVTAAKLNNDIISGTTALTSEPADTDEFLVSDAGTLKRIDYSLIKGGGITVADQWRLTADKANVDTSYTAFDSNLERVDTSGQGTIGSAMSFDSGTGNFTFPATGIYLVKGEVTYQKDASRRYTGLIMKITTNNSSYSALCEGYETINPPDGNSAYSYVSVSSLIDVTDTTNVKVQFGGSVPAAVTAIGDTAKNMTVFTFIRLGDT